jgi:outer membrane receptor protein involved in Fe transport
MKQVLLCCLTLFSFCAAISQVPPGAPGQGRRGGFGGQVPSIGHFYGKIVDARNNKGLDGVSVVLIQSKFDTVSKKRKDTVVSGMITESKGNFSLENLPIFGNFRLKITAIGYKIYEQKVAFDLKPVAGGNFQNALNNVDKDLGNIKLVVDTQSLEQVTVTANKPMMQLGIDRKIFNVEKDISAQGGTAVDIMKNIPSVAVDIDGNVTLRNTPPTIFVDGRPTTLTLDQIPADAIQSVEIITNPGAKYDASGGTAGILNIVLKKNRKAGYNGSIRAGVDERGKMNAGGDINIKQGKFNVFASGNFNQREFKVEGNTSRYTFDKPPYDSLTEFDHTVNAGYFVFGRFGIDYLMDNRNTISASGLLVNGNFSPTVNSNIYIDTLYPTGTVSSYSQRNTVSNGNFINRGGTLSYRHNFPKSGEDWTADFNYSKANNNNNSLVSSDYYSVKGGPLLHTYDQKQIGSGINEYITAQTDFENPINDKSKFEAGARAALRNVSSVNNIGTLAPDGTFIPSPLQSSTYSYHDQVYAAYGTYSNSIKDFGFQVGLRVESSNYQGTSNYTVKDNPSGALKDTVGNFSNSYPFNFFPSIFLTQKFGANQQLQVNYTRRIDRPNFFQLFPYIDYTDTLNLSQGNPNLKPQFTNSFEIAYQWTYGRTNTFLMSAYYKQTTDLITRYQKQGINPITDSVVFINTYINANSSFVGGIELMDRDALTKWWDITASINIYTSHIDAGDSIKTAPQSWSWAGKLTNSFKLPKNFTLQISGDYNSQTVLPPGGSAGNGGGGGRGFGGTVSGSAQGFTEPIGGVDASLRYEFLKNKVASVTLTCTDIFRTRINTVVTAGEGFNQTTTRIRDPQFFRLQFNWRFGKVDVSLFKRKNTRNDQENIQNNMQGTQQ